MLDYAEHALSAGSDAQAAAYVECEIGGRVWWGVGIDANTVTASLRAVLSAREPVPAQLTASWPAAAEPAGRERRGPAARAMHLAMRPAVRRQWQGEPVPG